MAPKTPPGRWPLFGWLGLGLVAVFWTLNWSLEGLRTHWAFFPMWLGYCLTMEALLVLRKGHSMLTRSLGAYFGLFIISIVVWWLFELLNLNTRNWYYDGREYFTDLQYVLLASLNFSTVMPAVFSTAEIAGTFRWLKNNQSSVKLFPTPRLLISCFTAGWIMLALLILWPHYFFVFIWLSVFFIIEPINVWLGYRSFFNSFCKGDWRPLWALWVGCLICGFFWEMWNFYSYPKWIYDVPFVSFWHIFEMPLIGYMGYLPFSLELFAIYNLLIGLFGLKEDKYLVQID